MQVFDKDPPIESLHEALCRVPDPRAGNSKYHIGAMLSVLAMAVFSGHRRPAQVVRFSNRMHMNHRKALSLPRRKGGNYRDVAGIVRPADHETGVPAAMTGSSRKEGEGDRCEMKAGQKPVEAEESLDNTIITAEADSRTPGQREQPVRGRRGGIENRNHWRKNACLFEDRTTSKQSGTVAAFGLLRNILLFLHAEQQIHDTISGHVEAIAADPGKACSMLKARL